MTTDRVGGSWATLIWSFLFITPGPAVLQADTGSSAIPQEHPQTKEEGRRRPTAEELLQALRRKRPLYDVIPPASALQAGKKKAARKLLPEGSAVVDQTGALGADGTWWTFVFDSSDEFTALKLLPNSTLEVMVRTARGSSTPIRFLISGETTVFEDENFLLIRAARRVTRPQEPLNRSGGSPPSDSAEGKQPSSADTGESGQGASNVPVDQVLTLLQRQEPTQALLPELPATPGVQTSHRTMAVPTVLAEGSTLVRRPGRLIREGHWWAFAFESDSPDHPEPPIKLLPNKSVELMVKAGEREPNGLVFLLTGEVTLFEGENYLLPTVALRRINAGNLTK